MDVRKYDKVSRYILHIEFKLGRGGAGNSPTQAHDTSGRFVN